MNALLFALLVTVPGAADDDAPNVLLILADDLGYGDVGAFNSDSKIATPNLDTFAETALRLTDAHSSASWCIPTRYSILTGRFPIGLDTSDRDRAVIADGLATLPGTLAAAGYATSMVGKWHLGFSEGEASYKDGDAADLIGGPVDRGFARYFGIPRSLDIPPYYTIRDRSPVGPLVDSVGDANSEGWSKIQGEFWRAGKMTDGFRHVDITPQCATESLAELKRLTEQDQPWFHYLALPSPHTPWVPTDEWAGKSEVPLYGDFMEQVDDVIGRVIAAAGDDTLVIVTSDNGPVWYEDDNAKYGHCAAGGFRGMKGDAWEGGHRVPMMVRWTGHIEPGTTDALWNHADFFATIAAAAGIDVAESAIDSVNQLPHWQDRSGEPPRTQMVQQSSRKFHSIRNGQWKYIPALGSGGFTKPSRRQPAIDESPFQLYDLATDPGERTNLAVEQPEVLQQMQTLYDELMAGRLPN